MLSSEFVKVYPRDLREQPPFEGPILQQMTEARRWSLTWGTILHDHLNGIHDSEIVPEAAVPIYGQWVNENLGTLNKHLTAHPSGRSLRALNEIGFHKLNGNMGDMWAPLMTDQWDRYHKSRDLMINIYQDNLAINGMYHYLQREHEACAANDYAYFKAPNWASRTRREGEATEYDLGIIALEFIKKRPDLTVVPGPKQFEDSNSHYNADYVVVSSDQRCIGLQAKNDVDEEDMARYDKDRIVLIDGRVDLDNQKAVRVDAKDSDKFQMGWAGLICMQHILNLPTHGPRLRSALLTYGSPRAIASDKMLAKQALHDIRVNIPLAVSRVSQRILEKL